MEREDVNELILQKVNRIDDDQIRNFIEDVLRFERAELDKSQPHYKSDFGDYLQKYIDDWESYDDPTKSGVVEREDKAVTAS